MWNNMHNNALNLCFYFTFFCWKNLTLKTVPWTRTFCIFAFIWYYAIVFLYFIHNLVILYISFTYVYAFSYFSLFCWTVFIWKIINTKSSPKNDRQTRYFVDENYWKIWKKEEEWKWFSFYAVRTYSKNIFIIGNHKKIIEQLKYFNYFENNCMELKGEEVQNAWNVLCV